MEAENKPDAAIQNAGTENKQRNVWLSVIMVGVDVNKRYRRDVGEFIGLDFGEVLSGGLIDVYCLFVCRAF